MMHSQLIQGTSAFDQLSAEWDDLAGRGITDTPFQTAAYLQAWWHHLHPADSELYTIAVRHDDGSLAAIASLYVADGAVHFNGCIEETDYLDLIVTPADAEAAWTAVFDCFLSDEFPQWHTLDLCNIPAASPSRAILQKLAADRQLAFSETVNEVCPIIYLPTTFEAYMDSLDSKQRRETNRKLRRAKGAEAQVVTIGKEDDLPTAVDEFLDLLQKSMYEKRDWLNDGRRAVFHDVAQAALDNGTLQLMFIEVAGKKGAALFNFDYKERVWVYNSGFDPESFGGLSLGVVLTTKAIEQAIENGRAEFDFLRGNEPYKYQFGAQDTEIYRIHIERPQ